MLVQNKTNFLLKSFYTTIKNSYLVFTRIHKQSYEMVEFKMPSLDVLAWDQGDQKILKNAQCFKKVAQTVYKPKKDKISTTKLNLKAPKHVHQTHFETLKYLQQTMF